VADCRVLIDTGPLVAIASEDDQYHQACVETLASLPPPLLICWPVMTEAAWLLRQHRPSLDRLFAAFQAGMIEMLTVEPEALDWIA
jgi:predicted nucleic acid-binding protein